MERNPGEVRHHPRQLRGPKPVEVQWNQEVRFASFTGQVERERPLLLGVLLADGLVR